MAKTYSSIYIHYVFSTKNSDPLIAETFRDRLWSFMGGIARDNCMMATRIGGMEDHVHLLLSLPTTISIAKGIQLIEGGSSAWVNENIPGMGTFGWQEGYGAFSVSISHLPETIAYIDNQAKHHRERSFQEEYLGFLKKHGIHCDERYVWD